MLYKIVNGSVSYGGDAVLEQVDIEIKDREKIAVVGRNGSGKTTLLKAITGEVELDEGVGEEPFSVTRVGSPVVGYLKQISFTSESATMREEILGVFAPLIRAEQKMAELMTDMERGDVAAVEKYDALRDRYELDGGLTYKKEYLTMSRKFGFTDADLDKPISEFSGGQRTKIAFIKLLLGKPDILLLDEPTNHLDMRTVRWLETYLKSYKSAVVLVSHDRMFLDRIVDKVYEIEYGVTECYRGNYTAFEKLKSERRAKQLKDHERQAAEIARLTRLIERFRYKATKARMVQSRIGMLERMKRIEAPAHADLRSFRADIAPRRESSREVLVTNALEVGYDKPLACVTFTVGRGDRLGIVGDNGCGKSTLLKTLMGIVPRLSGSYAFGFGTEVGYFDQQTAQATGGKTVFESFADEFPSLGEREVRTALGAFRFTGDDVFKDVGSLSGGEKVALALCKLFRRRPNVLVLDEPTNHMDIVGKQTLENMLSSYTGTVIFVSHDRYFVDKLANKLLVFEKGGARFMECRYSEYEEQMREAEDAEDAVAEPTARPAQHGERYVSPKKALEKKLRRMTKLEGEIAELEKRMTDLTARLSDPAVYGDYVKVTEIQHDLEELTASRDALTDEWATLAEETEALSAQ